MIELEDDKHFLLAKPFACLPYLFRVGFLVKKTRCSRFLRINVDAKDNNEIQGVTGIVMVSVVMRHRQGPTASLEKSFFFGPGKG